MWIIIIIVISIIVTCVFFVTIYKMTKTYYLTKTMHKYNQAAKELYTSLNDMGVEWWPTEGTLIGILRWGKNFGKLDDGVIASDTDIDVMVRVKDQDQWESIKTELVTRFSNKTLWRGCKNYKINGINAKFTCYTHYSFGWKCWKNTDVHTDIHCYMVDEELNKAYLDKKCLNGECKKIYPFQNWGGTAPYRGLIVNNQGKLAKARFMNMDVPCPFYYIEILKNWNGNEYGNGNDLYLPKVNCVNKGKEWIKNDYKITDHDKAVLCRYAKELKKYGYASFSEYYKEKCPTLQTHSFSCRKGRALCFGTNKAFRDTNVSELIKMFDILQKNGLQPFITGGTLLGYMRGNDLLRNDDDIDISFFAKPGLDSVVQKVFEQNGYKTKKYNTDIANGIVGQYTFTQNIDNKPIEFDVSFFFHDKALDKYVYCTFFDLSIQYHLFSPFNIKKVQFLNRTFTVPNNTSKYLQEEYGFDWWNENSSFTVDNYSNIVDKYNVNDLDFLPTLTG